MDNNKTSQGITINLNINIDKAAVSMMRQLLGDFIKTCVSFTVNGPDAQDNPATVAADNTQPAAGTKAKETMFDIPAVARIIREYVALVEEGEDIEEASAAMTDDIRKITDGRVEVYLGLFGRFHKVMPNFRKTKEVAALYGKWSGFVSPDKIEQVLEDAFGWLIPEAAEEKVSTTPCGGPRAFVHRNSGYSQGSYTRVKKGSMMMRMRCHRNSDDLAPMVIDAELGKELFEEGYTHVAIGRMSKNNRPCEDSKYINLVFTKEDVRTRAECKSERTSRLHPYGSAADHITTYAINGDAFQRTILKYFGEDCRGHQERFFKLTRTGAANDRGIAFRIDKADLG